MAAISPARTEPACLPAASDWPDLEKLARFWHVAPTLWLALRNDPGLRDQPPDRIERLRSGYLENVLRNRHLRADVARISARLNSGGFVPLLLKGAAFLFARYGMDPGERYMHDFDLMVEPDRDARCFQFLRDNGFELAPDGSRYFDEERHQWPTLLDPESGLEVELHRRPFQFASRETTAAYHHEALAIEADGARMRLPAPHHRIIHNLLHAQIANDSLSHAYFNPGYLLEFAYFCVRLPPDVWLRAFDDLKHHSIAARSWIHLCRTYLSVSPPVGPEVRAVDRLQAFRIARRSTFGQAASSPVDAAIRLLTHARLRLRRGR